MRYYTEFNDFMYIKMFLSINILLLINNYFDFTFDNTCVIYLAVIIFICYFLCFVSCLVWKLAGFPSPFSSSLLPEEPKWSIGDGIAPVNHHQFRYFCMLGTTGRADLNMCGQNIKKTFSYLMPFYILKLLFHQKIVHNVLYQKSGDRKIVIELSSKPLFRFNVYQNITKYKLKNYKTKNTTTHPTVPPTTARAVGENPR